MQKRNDLEWVIGFLQLIILMVGIASVTAGILLEDEVYCMFGFFLTVTSGAIVWMVFFERREGLDK